MGSTKRIGFVVINTSGVPENAASLTLLWWDPATGNTSTAPTVTAHGSGRYSFLPGLAIDEARCWFAQVDTSHVAVPSGGQVAYEDQVQPLALGAGSQTVTLTALLDGAACQGVRIDVTSGGAIFAQGFTASDGTIVLNLDPGTYTVAATRSGGAWNAVTITVSSPNTVAPTSLSGMSVPSESSTPVGLTGSVAYTAPNYAGAIGPLAARDSWTITRDITALPAAIASAKFTVRAFGSPGTSLITATVTVTDATAPTGAVSVAIAADALSIEGGRYAYDFELTLADGSVRTVEIGVLTVTQHPSI
jgi:hypothetical protein